MRSNLNYFNDVVVAKSDRWPWKNPLTLSWQGFLSYGDLRDERVQNIQTLTIVTNLESRKSQRYQMIVLYGYLTLFSSFDLYFYLKFYLCYQEKAVVLFNCQMQFTFYYKSHSAICYEHIWHSREKNYTQTLPILADTKWFISA